MRISDLSRQTGLPVATIKFYLRERLLPPGKPVQRNQAQYGEAHLLRLQLIRAFTNVAKLDLSTVRVLLAGIDDEQLPLAELYEVVTSYPDNVVDQEGGGVAEARADVDCFLGGLGWQIDPNSAGRDQLSQVLAALRRLGCDCGIGFFAPYAAAADRLVAQEMDLLPAGGVGADRAAAVVRSVLLEVALTAVHRMAREHHAALRFDGDPGADAN
jgi:DNA-binding transcriptional MerR regulator